MSQKIVLYLLFLTLAVMGFQVTRSDSFIAQPEEIMIGTQYGDPIKGISAREFEGGNSG